jgi:WD40 repeat protein
MRSSLGGIAFSPDGALFSTYSRTGIIQLWDVSTGQFVKAYETMQNDVANLAFSSDGALLAYANYRDVITQSVDGVRQVMDGTGMSCDANLVFSPDGSLLACGRGVIRIFDVSSGKLVRQLK